MDLWQQRHDVMVKQLFGGLGQNFLNPALLARGILLAMTGRVAEGIALVEDVIRSGQTATAGTRNAWVGTYLYLMGRLHWTNGDHEALRDLGAGAPDGILFDQKEANNLSMKKRWFKAQSEACWIHWETLTPPIWTR